MDLRPSLQIKTVIKALADTVLPAVDPNNKLAHEQLQLAIATLQLISQRAPLQYRYDCQDLARLLEFAESLRQQAAGVVPAAAALQALEPSVDAARDVLARARAEPSELESAALQLREALGAAVAAAAAAASAEQLKPINAAVLAHAREQLLRERSWLSPQGWEPNLPDLESLIGR